MQSVQPLVAHMEPDNSWAFLVETPTDQISFTHTHTKWGRLLSFSLSLFLLLLWNIYFILDVIVRWKDLIYLYIFFFFFTYRDGGGGLAISCCILRGRLVRCPIVTYTSAIVSEVCVCVAQFVHLHTHTYMCVCSNNKRRKGILDYPGSCFFVCCVSHAYHIGPDYFIVYTV